MYVTNLYIKVPEITTIVLLYFDMNYYVGLNINNNFE